ILALTARAGGSIAQAEASRSIARPPVSDLGGWLPSDLAFNLLAGAGLPVAPWRLARSRAEAITAAEALGMPVVLKAERSGLIHKSDSGGVRLGLATLAVV